MSGAHCKEQRLGGVNCHSLRHPDMIRLLQEYKTLLQGMLGPTAGIVCVQHFGGLDSYVNSSSELIKKIQPHHPCLKFVNCLIEAQNSSYACLGLYVGILCTDLLRELLALEELGMPQRVVIDASNLILGELLDLVENKSSIEHIAKFDVSNLSHMIALVRTQIGSKNVGLNEKENSILCGKIVEAFLLTVPSPEALKNVFGDVIVTVVEGRPASEASVVEGILIREIDPKREIINRITNDSNLSNLKKYNSISNHPFLKYSRNYRNDDTIARQTNINIVIFNVPLSFEQSETENIKFTGGASNKDAYDEIISSQLRRLTEQEDIKIVASQKVISPVVQWLLERQGVLVIERLGTASTEALTKLAGCLVVSDITSLLVNANDHRMCGDMESSNDTRNNRNGFASKFASSGYIGHVTSIKVVEISDKIYLQLINNEQDPATSSQVVTFLLPSLAPASSDTLKVLTEGALACLRQAAVDPFVFSAAGCLEARLALAVVSSPTAHTHRHSSVDSEASRCSVATVTNDGDTDQVEASRYSVHAVPPGEAIHQSIIPDVDTGASAVDDGTSSYAELLRSSADEILDGLEVSLSEYRQVAAAISIVFVRLATLQSGGHKASSFDYYISPSLGGHMFRIQPEDRQSKIMEESDIKLHRNSCGKLLYRNSISENNCDAVQENEQNERFVDQDVCTLSNPSKSNNSTMSESFHLKCSCGAMKIVQKAELTNLVPIRDLYEPSAFNSFQNYSIHSVNSKKIPLNHDNSPYKSPHVNLLTSSNNDQIVIENYNGKLNALRLALEGAAQLLDVDYCVFDR